MVAPEITNLVMKFSTRLKTLILYKQTEFATLRAVLMKYRGNSAAWAHITWEDGTHISTYFVLLLLSMYFTIIKNIPLQIIRLIVVIFFNLDR